MSASVPEKPSGTWLWHRSSQGCCGEKLKKTPRKPYMSQLEKIDSCSSLNTSSCCMLCRTLNSVLVSVGISSFTWCVLRQRHSLNCPWPPVFFLRTSSQPRTWSCVRHELEVLRWDPCVKGSLQKDVFTKMWCWTYVTRTWTAQSQFSCILNCIRIVQVTQNYRLTSYICGSLWL